MSRAVLHVILNSHLDPAWLWSRAQGEDAALATARTTCDLLDEFPEIHATRGEAWFYETVERFDPARFRRLRRHVADGRLHVVGGWYVQPDCNLASASTYALHGRVAGAYFRRRLGVRVRTGFNPDSFGHAATLPDFYAAAGIENYLFMRPDPREKADLPGEVFRWRGPGGALRLTLLRTPFFAHHDPGVPAKDCPEPVADLGERWFDIALLADAGEDAVRRERYRQTGPLRFSETTLGM